MLVFYFPEYLFNKILKGDKTGSSPEFINHHRHRLLLAHKTPHHFVGKHGLGRKDDRFEPFAPVGRRIEKLGHMYITEHIVDIVLINYDLRQACRYEFTDQFLSVGTFDRHGYDLVARSHAFRDLCILKIYGFTEDPDFILDLLSAGILLNRLLYVIIQFIYSQQLRRG